MKKQKTQKTEDSGVKKKKEKETIESPNETKLEKKESSNDFKTKTSEKKSTSIDHEVKKEKKNHKKLIIGIVVAILVLALAIGGYFLKQYLDLKKPIDDAWGQTYYVYLKDIKENDKAKDAGIPNDMENARLNFYEVKNVEDPVMIMTYTKDDDSYSNVYYIEDNKVNALTYNESTNIELLYNILTKEYDYYIHIDKDGKDSYKSLSEQIKERHEELDKSKDDTEDKKEVQQTVEYTFSKDEEEAVTDVNGKKISIAKFDKTFIKPEVETVNGVEYSTDLEEKELKETVTNTISNYKPQEEIITEQVEKEVATKVEQVAKKQEEMKKAEEEVKKREAMKITSQNIQSKIGTHLKWFKGAYLGVIYGWPSVFTYKDVTDSVKIPGMYEGSMVYEVVGVKSINSLKSQLANYVSKDKFSKFGRFTNDFTEYNGKVYWCNLGVGDGPLINTKNAKVLSSENGISKIQLQQYNALSNTLEETITLTVKYNEDTGKYLITDWTVTRHY